MFDTKEFKSGELVSIALTDKADPYLLIRSVLTFVAENKLHPLWCMQTGVGTYYAVHTRMDAKRIKKFLDRRVFEVSKVLNAAERKKDPVTFSESYNVRYRYLMDDGFWADGTTRYYGASKSLHDQVRVRFNKDYPKAKIVSVVYE